MFLVIIIIIIIIRPITAFVQRHTEIQRRWKQH